MSMAHAPGSRRYLSLLGALALALIALAVPAAARADDQSCSGKLKRIAKTEDRDTGVAYQLRCAQPITAFVLVTPIELTGFDVSADVFDPASAGGGIRGDDRLGNCTGDIPSFGFTCAGTYSAQNRVIRSAFDTTANPCGRTKSGDLKLWASAVVLNETGELAGPYPLSKIRGCPRAHKSGKHKHGKSHAAARR
jgi:hypothetical protein